MTIVRRVTVGILIVLASGLVGGAAPAPPAGVEIAQLKAITSRISGKSVLLVIEATEPAPYVTTQPDPLTLYVDFRNVGTTGVINRFANDGQSPIADVAVEASESLGAQVSRIRVTLAEPATYRVRSDRSTVVIVFEKRAAAPYVLPPVSRARPDAMTALAAERAAAADPARPDVVTAAPILQTASPALIGQPLPPLNAPVAQARPVQAPVQPQALPPAAPGAPVQVAVAQPPPQAPAGQIGNAPAERRFTGNPVSLDFQGADLRAVLRTFSDISGLNMVIDPAVQGTVDVALREVPWDQALDIILRANKLGYIIDGTIVRIAPLTVLAEEEAQRRRLSDEQALAGELRVFTKTVSYAKAEDLVGLLTKSALSARGTVQVDPRTNTLIITDLADRLQTASDLISTLDKPQPQVEIEARIVQTTKDFSKALGIQWGFQGRVDPRLGNTTNLAFPNNGSIQGQASGGANTPAGTAVNLPAIGAPSAVGLALGSINGAFNLDVALSALIRDGHGRLLSTPRVSTQNNVEAEIAQGVQIGYQTVANNTVTISFRDAALTLKVLPQITASDTVIMKISVDNGSVGALYNNIPSINTQRANTTVQVNDGQTTVIGGIYATQENATNDRTPGLSNIPIIKWLFKRDTIDESSRELLIFITPRIIKG